jgi:hypothetical protein
MEMGCTRGRLPSRQLSSTARGTGVSLFACALFLGQSSGVLAASFVAARLSTTAWFAAASPILLALGVAFGVRLHSRMSKQQAAA